MKKQFAIIALGLIISATVLESCKKGENDPGISFRSRKGRFAGEWKATKAEGTQTDGTTNETWTYDGTTKTTTVTIGSSSFTNTETIAYEMVADKDGTFKMTETQTFTSGNVMTTTSEGTWNFTGKVGEDKNKDHVVMRISKITTTNTSPSSTTTYTYTGDDCPAMVSYIDRLSNKEVIMKYDGSNTVGSTTTTTTESWTYEPK